MPNGFSSEGKFTDLDIFFRNGTSYSTFYIRLFNDIPVDSDTLSDLTGEPVGNGYSAQPLSRNAIDFDALDPDNGDYILSAQEVVFTASGGTIGPVVYAVLATSANNSGKLIAYAPLSQARIIPDGDKLVVGFRIKMT